MKILNYEGKIYVELDYKLDGVENYWIYGAPRLGYIIFPVMKFNKNAFFSASGNSTINTSYWVELVDYVKHCFKGETKQ